MGVLTQIKNMGVKGILIACMDGLSLRALRAIYQQTRIQLYIVHMIRNSTKFIFCKDLKKMCESLKDVYSANSEEAGRDAL
jgi:transposase-like protein